jgi:hypothetical protein
MTIQSLLAVRLSPCGQELDGALPDLLMGYFGGFLTRSIRFQGERPGWPPRLFLYALLAIGVAYVPPTTRAQTVSAGGEWREFQGTWTAVGNRQIVSLGGDRRASIASFNGSLMLSGPSRPSLGFRAEAIVFNDSATGMVGRAVWTDERGDQVYSELRGEITATGNRIVGTFLGGSGRYAGAMGAYEFSWRFLLEAEDGAVQGQSMGLKGRLRAVAAQGAPGAGGSR